MLTLVEPKGFDLIPLLAVVLPASLIGLTVAAIVQHRLGAPLERDEEYQRRLAAGEIHPIDAAVALKKGLPRSASMSAYTFLAGVGLIILLGVFPVLRPEFPTGSGGALVPLGTGQSHRDDRGHVRQARGRGEGADIHLRHGRDHCAVRHRLASPNLHRRQ
jgi:hypothetical protein